MPNTQSTTVDESPEERNANTLQQLRKREQVLERELEALLVSDRELFAQSIACREWNNHQSETVRTSFKNQLEHMQRQLADLETLLLSTDDVNDAEKELTDRIEALHQSLSTFQKKTLSSLECLRLEEMILTDRVRMTESWVRSQEKEEEESSNQVRNKTREPGNTHKSSKVLAVRHNTKEKKKTAEVKIQEVTGAEKTHHDSVQTKKKKEEKRLETFQRLREWKLKCEREAEEREKMRREKEKEERQKKACDTALWVLQQEMMQLNMEERQDTQENMLPEENECRQKSSAKTLALFRQRDSEMLAKRQSKVSSAAEESTVRRKKIIESERNPQRLLVPTESWLGHVQANGNEEKIKFFLPCPLPIPVRATPAWRQGL